MRAVGLPRREALELAIRITAVLVDQAIWRGMKVDPFIKTDRAVGGNRQFEVAPVLETVIKIRKQLPEIAPIQEDRLLAPVLVPNTTHARADGTHGLEKLCGGEWATIVELTDQE